MRLIFAGTPDVAAVCLEALLASPRHEVVGVLTRPDAPSGRGRVTTRSPVGALADAHGLPVMSPARLRDPGALDQLRELEPDCCPVVAYGALIPRDALGIPPFGWVNLHFSLLPAWRGAAPVQRALLAGDDVTGATTFLIEEGMDTGPVLGVMTEGVRPSDTSGDLLARLAHGGTQLLMATLDGLESGTLVPAPQPVDGISLAPKLSVQDARVDWDAASLRIDRLIRACTPDPGAWTTWRGERLKLGPARISGLPAGEVLAPGRIQVSKDGVLVGTATSPVRLGDVQPPGKRMMPALDWARGARLEPDERLD
jgi:methionyl-tRNA formyltransferase